MGSSIFANSIVELFLEFLADRSIADTVISVERWQDILDRVTTLAGRFLYESETKIAELIIEDFESALMEAHVEIESDGKDSEASALILGDDYSELEDSIMYYADQCLF